MFVAADQVTLSTLTAEQMRKTRRKAAIYIFEQLKKAKKVEPDAVFNEAGVSYDDIEDGQEFYGGFILVLSVAGLYATQGLLLSAADGAHCEGKGPYSYGTYGQLVVYDHNNNLLPAVYTHTVGNEDGEFWEGVYSEASQIPGYDVPGQTCMVDMEKSIDTRFKAKMKHARTFLDERHVVKNMSGHLGDERATGLGLYQRALRAPSKELCDAIVAQFGPKQTAYLARYKKEQLYRSYSALQDSISTSQGAESSMCAALRNNIRSVEPLKMLQTIVEKAKEKVLSMQKEAANWTGPLPPRTEKRLAKMIRVAKLYHVREVPGTNQMEWTVESRVNPTQSRRVVLSPDPYIPPACCAYSLTGEKIPCYHGLSVVVEKHGPANAWKFLGRRLHAVPWQEMHSAASLKLPAQVDVDSVMLAAKRSVLSGEALQNPKALPPPRGGPTGDAGVRKKSWLETGGSSSKVRAYMCSLCAEVGHKRNGCPLRQKFADAGVDVDSDDDDDDDDDDDGCGGGGGDFGAGGGGCGFGFDGGGGLPMPTPAAGAAAPLQHRGDGDSVDVPWTNDGAWDFDGSGGGGSSYHGCFGSAVGGSDGGRFGGDGGDAFGGVAGGGGFNAGGGGRPSSRRH